MNSTTTPQASPARPVARPRTDVFETAEELVLVADVPGADASSLELTLEEDVLLLRAGVKDAVPEGFAPVGAGLELPDYERRFRIHAELEREAASASLANGVLRVVLRKRLPRASRIEIRPGAGS